MIKLRRAADRGSFDHGWLKTAHTFSFADYRDPEHMGFRALRVINEDVVAPGQGFGMHPHRDMEILTWVLDGALRHEDGMGHDQVLRPNEVQVMSAGTGVVHSEWNASETEPVHLLQIWVLPERRGIMPRYDQRAFDRAAMCDRLLLVAAPPGGDGLVDLHQDVRVFATELGEGSRVRHELEPGRAAWLQVARGEVWLGKVVLGAGDGAAIFDESALELMAAVPSEALLFDLA